MVNVMQMGQSEIDAKFRKLKVQNSKQATYIRSSFQNLARLVSASIATMAEYNPSKSDPANLRKNYAALYNWLSRELTDLYEFDFDPELLTDVSIEAIKLKEGVITISVAYTMYRVTKRFKLTANNEGAPFSTEWPKLLEQAGGDSRRYNILQELV